MGLESAGKEERTSPRRLRFLKRGRLKSAHFDPLPRMLRPSPAKAKKRFAEQRRPFGEGAPATAVPAS